MNTKHTINEDRATVKALIALLNGGHAHAKTDEALANLPAKLRGEAPHGLPYSIWQLAEHIRITQWDILEFSRNPNHVSPKWPDEYWPEARASVSDSDWEKTLAGIKADRDAFIELLKAPDVDLYTPFSYGDGQNLLREAMLIADHTSYHTGEILVIRRLLGAWD